MRNIVIQLTFAVVFSYIAYAQGRGRVQPQAEAQAVPVRPEERAVVEGTVYNAMTGEPVRKANVTLRRAQGSGPGGPGGMGGMGGPGPGGMSYTASSDSSGQFRIADIEPGRYRLMVEKAGFVDQWYGARQASQSGTVIALEKSQRMRDASVKLTPQGVVAGRVLDEDGDPILGASVQISKRTYVRGRRTLVPVDNASTNDNGEFRLYGLSPGRYYLSAVYRRGSRGQAVQEADQETYPPTYYPGGTSADAAAPIEIAPATQFRGMDIRLQKTRAVRVSGRVVGVAAGASRGGTTIALIPRDEGFNFAARNVTRPHNAQGDFVIANVVPGSYVLMASQFEGGKMLAARLPVTVGNAALDGVTLQLAPGADLKGSVKIEGQVPANAAANIRLSLVGRSQMMMFGPGAQAAAVKEDGTFTLANVQPEAYDLRVSGVPDGGYVKSIKIGNADVTETGIDFTGGVVPAEVAVVISLAAGQVEGGVQNEKSEAAAGVTVVLVPEGERRRNDRYYGAATSDAAGHFVLKNIAPGEYRVLAFESVESGAYMDPEWLQPFESKGERVSIRENGRETVNLRMIPTPGS